MQILEHLVKNEGVRADEERIDKIKEGLSPTLRKKLISVVDWICIIED